MIGPWLWWACASGDTYIVEGTVVSLSGERTVTLDHREVRGLMGPMVMPFEVSDPTLLEGVRPGARVVARLRIDGSTSQIEALRVTGHGDVPVPAAERPLPLAAGERLTPLDVALAGGGTLRIGRGQAGPVLVGFVYTRCPVPEACPMAVSKMMAMQDALPPGARILAVTIDPAFDTVDVLSAYGQRVGAAPGRWDFGRLDPESTAALAWAAALQVIDNGATVEHGNRWLVLAADGVLVERYDDHVWALDRVYQQLAK